MILQSAETPWADKDTLAPSQTRASVVVKYGPLTAVDDALWNMSLRRHCFAQEGAAKPASA